MSHNVETMAYTNQVPWHGLGFKVNNDLTPNQMLKAAKVDWAVEKRKVGFINSSGNYKVAPDKFALVRTSDDSMLSMVGTTYKPVQNEEAFDFFKKYCAAGHMTMETGGSLWNGRYVWCLAKIGKDFTLGKGDKVEGYVLMSSPHMIGRAMVIQFTPIRVVCWNTYTLALGADLKGRGGAFRMPHSVAFNDAVKHQAEVALGLAKEQMTEFNEAALLLTKAKVKPEKVQEYFCEVLKFNPKDAVKKKNGELKTPRMLEKFKQALTLAPGQNITTAQGTMWGAYNAVSYVVDHDLGHNRSSALYTAWYGQKATLKRRALGLALDAAK
jgi:phage/plasmid-like protein (TIGR03299 family)